MRLLILPFISLLCAAADTPAGSLGYKLGPGDRVQLHLDDLKEIELKSAVIDADGALELPWAGRVAAAGLTCTELSKAVEQRFKTIVREPRVRCEVAEYGSQPISLLGAVNKPGVYQLRGNRSLVDVLAMGEGLKPEAGNVLKITRAQRAGKLPLPGARADAGGEFYTADVNLKALLEARQPELNIAIRPHDVLSIPRAELIYVLGNVRKPGGFPLAERESMTVLQALALAEGVDALAASQNARVIRTVEPNAPRQEVPVDVKKILEGRAPDQPLLPNDILFVPNSRSRSAGLRALEVAIQLGTGIAIFRR